MAIPPPQAAELMGLFDLLTGASEFDEKSLTTTIVPTEKNSKDDENRTSPITGWEVALFSDSERYDENVIAEIKSKEFLRVQSSCQIVWMVLSNVENLNKWSTGGLPKLSLISGSYILTSKEGWQWGGLGIGLALFVPTKGETSIKE
ncbi:hypothetical protein glysoja_042002 [Glycine soja]|uniref:Uncharacterized protein n=1 Tax=Glycine soja TaxID=3848 RepID=A0A0B2QS33_GLYSO|nr:hypothetical protein glysoja_042002 [Glycine soja]